MNGPNDFSDANLDRHYAPAFEEYWGESDDDVEDEAKAKADAIEDEGDKEYERRREEGRLL